MEFSVVSGEEVKFSSNTSDKDDADLKNPNNGYSWIIVAFSSKKIFGIT